MFSVKWALAQNGWSHDSLQRNQSLPHKTFGDGPLSAALCCTHGDDPWTAARTHLRLNPVRPRGKQLELHRQRCHQSRECDWAERSKAAHIRSKTCHLASSAWKHGRVLPPMGLHVGGYLHPRAQCEPRSACFSFKHRSKTATRLIGHTTCPKTPKDSIPTHLHLTIWQMHSAE